MSRESRIEEENKIQVKQAPGRIREGILENLTELKSLLVQNVEKTRANEGEIKANELEIKALAKVVFVNEDKCSKQKKEISAIQSKTVKLDSAVKKHNEDFKNEVIKMMGQTDKKIGNLELKIYGLEKKLDSTDNRLCSLEKKMGNLEVIIDGIDKKFIQVNRNICCLDIKFSGLEAKVDKMAKALEDQNRLISNFFK